VPLDGHLELGNNAQLARVLGLQIDGWSGEQSLVAYGRPDAATNLREFQHQVAVRLGREPLVIGDLDRPLRRLAWCAGAAQDALELAITLGVDAFLTGEVSERTVHLARESGVAFISAGHHATERYGVQALGDHLALRFGLRHQFVDIANPV
jgi:putative NIF3 family GTP cyclohydrolase 1 type 2